MIWEILFWNRLCGTVKAFYSRSLPVSVINERMAVLRGYGIKFAMDDFGIGTGTDTATFQLYQCVVLPVLRHGHLFKTAGVVLVHDITFHNQSSLSLKMLKLCRYGAGMDRFFDIHDSILADIYNAIIAMQKAKVKINVRTNDHSLQ